MKKIISLTLICLLMVQVSLSTIVKASTVDPDKQKIQQFIDYGFTKEEVTNSLKIEKILNKMKDSGQIVDLVNGEVKVISDTKKDKNISKEEENFLIDSVKSDLTIKKKSTKEKMEDINKLIEKNPLRSTYRVTYANGSWFEVRIKLETAEPINSDKVNVYFDNPKYNNEVEIGGGNAWPSDGYKSYEMNIVESANSRINISWTRAYYTVSNGGTHIHMNSAVNGVNSIGIATVSNKSASITHYDSDLNNQPTWWGEAVGDIVWLLSGSVGVTLAGVYSMSVSVGSCWTEFSIIRVSVVQAHSYAAHM